MEVERRDDEDGDVAIVSTEVDPLNETNGTKPDVIDVLCEDLADRVGHHRDDVPPAVTAKWRKDMRLLLQRGPLDQKAPTPIAPGTVASALCVIFEQLADPGRTGFCWADQVQSPGALRKHWHKIRTSARSAATNHPDVRQRDRLSRIQQMMEDDDAG